MSISEEDAGQVVATLISAFPSPKVPAETADLYVDRLVEPPFSDLALLYDAAMTWVETADRFPTLNQLLTGYQAEARRAAVLERSAHLGTLALPGAETDETYGRGFRSVLAEVMSRHGNAPHDHRGGIGTCTTCSSRETGGALIETEVLDLAADRGLIAPTVAAVRTYRCHHCLDVGWIEHGVHGFAPCSACSEAQYELWLHGCYRPNHHGCDRCRRGRGRR